MIAAAVAPESRRGDGERVERRRERACHRTERGQRGRNGDDRVLAEAVADGPEDRLHQAVGNGERGDDPSGHAVRDVELPRDLRQQRIVAALANAASARNAIARVGTGSGRASGMAFAMGARR